MHPGWLWRVGAGWAGWGEGGAERWGMGKVPMWVEAMSVGLGYAVTGGGGIGLVWVVGCWVQCGRYVQYLHYVQRL